ncbi:MAG: tail fiber domain-containing protein [Nitrospirota bacterium]
MTQRIGILGVLVASLVIMGGLAQAQVPQLINYQGVLKNGGGTPITGTVSVTFSIYSGPSGGTALWSETQSVVVTGGLFNVLLGSSTAFPAYFFQGTTPDRYLGVKVGSDPEMTPRQRLVSVGYTLKAEDADSLGDRIAITDKPNQRVGVGTLSPQAKLHAEVTSPAGEGTMWAIQTLSNSSPLPSTIDTALRLRINDQSTANILSKQVFRLIYFRDAAATGSVTDFDSTMVLANFINSNAPYSLRGITVEGPQIATGRTLNEFIGLFVREPSVTGTIASNKAIVTDPRAGNIGFGVTNPTERLEVAGNVRATAYLTGSSRELKKGITPLGQNDYAKIMDQINDLQMVRYLYKTEDNRQPHLGVIAEESPKEILDETGKAVSLADYAGFILAGLKAQSEEIQALKAHIRDLESKLPAPENQAAARVE